MTRVMSLLLCCFVASEAVLIRAAPPTITLPPEVAKLRASELPGYLLATQQCATCHSADYIEYQPPAMNLEQWTAEVSKMQHSYGAPISDANAKVIGAYLATTYGSAKATDTDVVAASNLGPARVQASEAQGRVAAASAPNVTTLLSTNACLSCHAVDKKVVGPAYHDVATRYAGDPQAQTEVAASIRSGGSGKWGQVPMPSFPQLTDDEVTALAGFVLHQ